MNILITGGAGFIGSNLVLKLLNQNFLRVYLNGTSLLKKIDNIYIVDNFITSDQDNFNQLVNNNKIFFKKTDITSVEFLRLAESFEKIDLVFHLACPTGVPNLKPKAEEMLLTCSIGTKNILDLSLKHNAKVLFASSSEVYGDPQIFPQTEEYTGNVDCIGIRSPYEEGKRFSESLVKTYTEKYSLDTRIIRIFNTYGPFMSRKDTRVIPQFIQQSLSNKPLTIKGHGENKRTFCFVDDLLDGFFLSLEKGYPGEVYNLGSDREVSINKLAEMIITLSKSSSKIVHIEGDSHDHKARKPSLERIKQLDWYQKINLEEGLLKTIMHYRI